MYIVLSHAVAFASLFVGSIFDLKTTEVPDSVSVVGVIGGILLHFMASLQEGFNLTRLLDFSLLLSTPLTWFQALGEPLLWSLGVGIILSLVGWGMYFLGIWGGADAFAMSVIGFAAPTGLTSYSVIHSIDLFVNILIAGFVYTLGFAVYKSWGTDALNKTYNMIKENELRVSIEVILAALMSGLAGLTGGINPVTYFLMFLTLIFLYRYMKIIQEDIMKEEVPVSELEGGEILDKGELDDDKVRGIRKDEIDQLDSEKVVVRKGVRFIPVFPAALIMTDLFGLGVPILFALVSL